MKLNIKINFQNNQVWNFDNSLLQGVFYNILKESPNTVKYHNINFGLFSFSNIFPFEKGSNYKSGVDYYITFSSIDKQIINTIYEKLLLQKEFDFGKDNKIIVKNVFKQRDDKIFSGKTLKSVTPIVLSLDKELMDKYGIESKRKDKNKPLYWNKDMGFDIFVNQLNKNILKKYVYLIKNNYIPKLNDFDQKLLDLTKNIEKISDFDQKLLDLSKDIEKFSNFAENQNFFKRYKFKRGALIDFKGGKVAGSLWDFVVGDDKNFNKVLYYVNQIGFGERSSFGFGFIK